MAGGQKRGKRRGKGKPNSGTANGATVSKPGAPDGLSTTIDLWASIDFHEAISASKNDAAKIFTSRDDGPVGAIRYQVSSSEARKVLTWFQVGCTAQKTAELWFGTDMTKEDRRELHRLCKAEFPGLKTVSRGVAEQRQVGVLHSESTKCQAVQLDEGEEFKARVWVAALQAQGEDPSVDEVRERIANDDFTDEQQQLLLQAVAEQKQLQALLEAMRSGTPDKALSLVTDQAGKVNVQHHATGETALHVAAELGLTAVMQALLSGGAAVEQLDGKQRTALQVARAAEQCDAEGLLLRAGAHDPQAAQELPEASAIPEFPASTEDNGSDIEKKSTICEDPEPPRHEGPLGPADSKASNEASTPPEPTPPQSSARSTDNPKDSTDSAAATSSSPPLPSEVLQASAAQSTPDSVSPSVAPGAAPGGAPSEVPRNPVPEIEPAPPRVKGPDSEDLSDLESLNGPVGDDGSLEAASQWIQAYVSAASDWCRQNPSAVATIGAGAAFVGLALLSRRRALIHWWDI